MQIIRKIIKASNYNICVLQVKKNGALLEPKGITNNVYFYRQGKKYQLVPIIPANLYLIISLSRIHSNKILVLDPMPHIIDITMTPSDRIFERVGNAI